MMLSVLVLPLFLATFLKAEITCPDGFTLLNGGKCVRLGPKVSHEDAGQYCKAMGAIMVSITNSEDNDEVSRYVNSFGFSFFWIGTFCYTINGDTTCVHDDNSGAISYSNFASGYPKKDVRWQCVYSQIGRLGGSLWMTTSGCNDRNVQYVTVCEVPSTLVDPSCKYNYNGYCYIPSTEIPGVTQSTTYPKAQAICKANNANMVSIHSKPGVDYITSIFRNRNVTTITLCCESNGPAIPSSTLMHSAF